jgi:hypothetical protein
MSPPLTQPQKTERTLRISPVELSFAYQQFGALPKPGAIEVRVKPPLSGWTTTTTLVRNESGGNPWITLSPTQGRGNGTILVTVDPVILSPGEHSGDVSVVSKDASVAPATVHIHLNVTAGLPPVKPALSFDNTTADTKAIGHYRVIAFSFSFRSDALRQVVEVNRFNPGLNAKVFEFGGRYMVSLGDLMTHESAVLLQETAKRKGIQSAEVKYYDK